MIAFLFCFSLVHAGFDFFGDTPLTHACQTQSLAEVQDLVAAGSTEINSADAYGNTPLHYAVATHNVPLFVYLLRAGARIDLPNSEGTTVCSIIFRDLTSDLLAAFLSCALSNNPPLTAFTRWPETQFDSGFELVNKSNKPIWVSLVTQNIFYLPTRLEPTGWISRQHCLTATINCSTPVQIFIWTSQPTALGADFAELRRSLIDSEGKTIYLAWDGELRPQFGGGLLGTNFLLQKTTYSQAGSRLDDNLTQSMIQEFAQPPVAQSDPQEYRKKLLQLVWPKRHTHAHSLLYLPGFWRSLVRS